MPFLDKDNASIEAAYLKSNPNVQLSINGQTYTITFATMTQVNNKTKVSRKVRRETPKEQPQAKRMSSMMTHCNY